VRDVLVNGKLVLQGGNHTNAKPGRALQKVRGNAPAK
jgi:hypothetical protein